MIPDWSWEIDCWLLPSLIPSMLRRSVVGGAPGLQERIRLGDAVGGGAGLVVAAAGQVHLRREGSCGCILDIYEAERACAEACVVRLHRLHCRSELPGR